MKRLYEILYIEFLFSPKKKIRQTGLLLLSLLLLSSGLVAQNNNVVKGRVLDDKKEPLIGATVVVKGLKGTGTVTDINGQFTLNMPSGKQAIVVTYIGFQAQEVNVAGKKTVAVVLVSDSHTMNEVVVVGFGQQKKTSVVGAIAQTSGKVLERTGGVSSLGAALTGNLPGVVTMQTTSKPGEDDPQIVIRGVSSWNNSNPLILVDGIERPMSSVDINSVESVSVLKDASATAVYGVRGANGVILITTKRGVEGKVKVDVGFSASMKDPSKLPGKYDAYDALDIKNKVIEYELNAFPNTFSYYRPQSFIDNYRNQTTQEQRERYPNIDWRDLMFKNFAMSYNANVNVSGGTKSVKYFAALDYANEGDIVSLYPSGRGYNSGYAYNRLNSRANLDFDLTKTTTFKVNLFGSYGRKKQPWNVVSEGYLWAAAYSLPPDVFYPRYSDGSWGFLPTSEVNAPNSLASMATGGDNEITTTRLTTDFSLNQDLGILLKGLSARATISIDNSFVESSRGINDGLNIQKKYIDPVTGNVMMGTLSDGTTNFDFYPSISWSTNAGTVEDWSTYRNLNYQLQLFYNGHFGGHNVTAMGNFARQSGATGSSLPSYREDWVFRTTYNYKDKYFVEYNGAYNGSEKFSSANRFGFFSSGAIGWMISQEKFMKSLTFLDMLKLRYSYGLIGDDAISGRWLYMDVWNSGTRQSVLTNGSQGELSPYKWYNQANIGNNNVQWEKVTKKNFGADFSFFKNLIAGSVDVFKDHRTNILMDGNLRAIPSYFGFTPPVANVGTVDVNGYEIELRLSKKITNDLRLWANGSMTHAVDKVIDKDDPQLLDAYRKAAGYSNRQVRSTISKGFYNTWDELYGSTAFDTKDGKIPGNYRIVDFNADGIINGNTDSAPYGYSSNPQNTYNTTLGIDWKGFSLMAQFYGVNNVTRYVSIASFGQNYFNNAYDEGTYWSKANMNADSPNPRVNNNNLNDASWGTRWLYDGSYIRLKNAEVAYTFDSKQVKSIGLQSLRLYVNGNNLWLWTRTPDDREVNGGTGYPLVKRFNFGVKITL